MSYIPTLNSYDSFGRLRTGGTGQRLDVEFIYDKSPDFFDEITSNGTVTHNSDSRDLTLSISDSADGTHATMRSHPVPHTPGNSQLIEATGTLDLAAIGGGTAEVFLRSNITGVVTEETIEQSSWSNLSSGVDWSKSHIFKMDFQSLKVGTIRYSLVQGGQEIIVAEIDNDNEKSGGYWQLPSLGLYYRVYNDDKGTGVKTFLEIGYGDEENAIGFRYALSSANASATLRAICCTVKSEAGLDLNDIPGLPRSADRGASAKTVSTTLIPLISIKPAATFNSITNLGIAIPRGFTFQTTEAIRLAVVYGGTLTGDSFGAVDAKSMMEYDTAATAISGGVEIDHDYAYAVGTGPQSGRTTATDKGLLGKTVLWDRNDAVETGILSLCAIRTGSTDASVLAGLKWDEIR